MTESGGKYWAILLGLFGMAAFIDSMLARIEDDYSNATYSLIIAILCAYLVQQELKTKYKKIEHKSSRAVVLKDYWDGPIHIMAMQGADGPITIIGTDTGGNRVSCEVPEDSDVDMWCDRINEVMRKMKDIK